MAYWVTFSDGSQACVEIEHEDRPKDIDWRDWNLARRADAGRKARELKPELGVAAVDSIPYPANPRLNNISGCPSFCYDPNRCAGFGSCPKGPACSE